ncbi:methyltransferase FkbM [Nitrosopumilus sp. b3]|nr:methyltransferase FkbM [Nitrosopumilus sp. b3]
MMKSGKKSKFKIFVNLTKIIKNWYIIPLIYYGLIKNEFSILELKNGIKIKIRTKSTDLQALVNVFVIEEYQFPGFEIKENDIIIDIGGHIGLFALYATKNCKKGKIFCYEPVKKNYHLLKDNIEMNNISNVNHFNLAVSNDQKEIKIFLSEDDAGHSIIQSEKKFEIVNSTTLKKIMDVNNIEKCNFLKMDCEGAEFKILESLPDEYFIKIKKIVMEYHLFNNNYNSYEKMKERLQDLNFDISVKEYSKNLGLLYAIQRDENE